MRREGFGHAELAGAVAGGAAACASFVRNPLLAPVADLMVAAATAGIAAHATETSARERGVSPAGILHRVARDAAKRKDAPLAAHAVSFAVRARRGDARALRSAAMIVGKIASAHARGVALGFLGPFATPFRLGAHVAAPAAVVRAARESVAIVRAAEGGVNERAAHRDAESFAYPFVEIVMESLEPTLGRAPRGETEQTWEVAA
jgi:hypothetical protein